MSQVIFADIPCGCGHEKFIGCGDQTVTNCSQSEKQVLTFLNSVTHRHHELNDDVTRHAAVKEEPTMLVSWG